MSVSSEELDDHHHLSDSDTGDVPVGGADDKGGDYAARPGTINLHTGASPDRLSHSDSSDSLNSEHSAPNPESREDQSDEDDVVADPGDGVGTDGEGKIDDSNRDRDSPTALAVSPLQNREAEAEAALHDIFDEDDDEEDTSAETRNSGTEPQAAADVQATIDELFGEAEDLSSDDEPQNQKPSAEIHDAADEALREEFGDVVDDHEDIQDEVTHIPVSMPFITPDMGMERHFAKLPNFLSVETRPFNPVTYDEDQDDDITDEEGQARLKLRVENTARWRITKDENGMPMYDELGDPVRETNARLVRWSDDSLSLYLGSEIFDVHVMPVTGDFNHLFIRQGNGLLGQSVFKTKLAFRPHSTDSLTHRKMTVSMAERSQRAQKIRVIPSSMDNPEVVQISRAKLWESKERQDRMRDAAKRRLREKQLAKGKLTSGFLEDEDDKGVSLSALKSKYSASNLSDSNGWLGLSSDDDNDDDDELSSLIQPTTRKIDSATSSSATTKPVQRRTAAEVFTSDSDDEGGDDFSPRQKRIRRPAISDSDED